MIRKIRLKEDAASQAVNSADSGAKITIDSSQVKLTDLLDELLERKGGTQYAKNDKVLAKENPNRPLFSEETTRKVMGHLI